MPEVPAAGPVDNATTEALLALGAATLGESGGMPMRPRMHAVWPGARLAAPAFPVRCSPGDNLAVHVAVATAPAGRVLVVDVGNAEERGYWGEVLTTGAEARHLAGLVIDGGVRDNASCSPPTASPCSPPPSPCRGRRRPRRARWDLRSRWAG